MEDSVKKFKTLSAREREVLDLLCQGRSQKAIAQEMGIGTNGVKSHVNHIYQKLDLMDLEPRERGFILRDVYWPLHKAEPINVQEPEPEIEVFDAVPADFDQILERDEKVIRALVAVDAPEPVASRRRGVTLPCSLLAGVGLIGLVLISFFAFGGMRFAQGLLATETPTSTPTATSTSTLTPSLTPSQTATLTPSSTPTSTFTPTLTPTETLTPSATQTQTPRPSPTVDFGPIYELGEWHKAGDVWFRLSSYEIDDDFSPETISFVIEIWNQTNQEIRFAWNPDRNTWLTDNTGERYHAFFKNSENNETVPAQSRSLILLGVNDYTSRFDADFIFDASVFEVYYTVYNFSRLELATWRISIGK